MFRPLRGGVNSHSAWLTSGPICSLLLLALLAFCPITSTSKNSRNSVFSILLLHLTNLRANDTPRLRLAPSTQSTQPVHPAMRGYLSAIVLLLPAVHSLATPGDRGRKLPLRTFARQALLAQERLLAFERQRLANSRSVLDLHASASPFALSMNFKPFAEGGDRLQLQVPRLADASVFVTEAVAKGLRVSMVTGPESTRVLVKGSRRTLEAFARSVREKSSLVTVTWDGTAMP